MLKASWVCKGSEKGDKENQSPFNIKHFFSHAVYKILQEIQQSQRGKRNS
jgi:hypothetical protein